MKLDTNLLLNVITPLFSSIIGGSVVAYVKYRYDKKAKWSDLRIDVIRGIEFKTLTLDANIKLLWHPDQQWKVQLQNSISALTDLSIYYDQNYSIFKEKVVLNILHNVNDLIDISKKVLFTYGANRQITSVKLENRDRDESRRTSKEYKEAEARYKKLIDIVLLELRTKIKGQV
ncbi:hypothetical protein GCM10009122_42190 [Fulvivirga kasyanovii]|uniref:Uncharacterized protein n=1 Tax=Fulvivirga kasyanovii TaxID=396812 RepID=A0ABW9RLG6_9BACT|nr:hypothetical protein [Fulvivirga kasyanovii]MTI23745.1 hypothetical protein [Fulvivirga kasyanovii]